MTNKGTQSGKRHCNATEYVIRSHGRLFSHGDFMEAVQLPRATASRCLDDLQIQGWIVQDEDTHKYRMSLSFRNMLVAVGAGLAAIERKATA